MNIESIIPKGKANAIHNDELANLLGVTPARARVLVRQARNEGVQILSGTNGYWLAESDEERSAFVNSMYKQAISRLKSIKAIKHSLNNVNGQISLANEFKEVLEREQE